MGGGRDPLCTNPEANAGDPFPTGPLVLIWGGVGGPDVRGADENGPERGPVPECRGAAGPPTEDGNTPGGGGLEAKERG